MVDVITWVKGNWLPVVVVLGVIIIWLGTRTRKWWDEKKALKQEKAPDQLEKALVDKGFEGTDNPEGTAIDITKTFKDWEQKLHQELLRIGRAIQMCEKDMAWRKQVHARLKQDEVRVREMLGALRQQKNQ